ncbi:MAG: GH3 auxin-responsive promoter family protein, partial [Bacteroidota bacterium]|nr:GH3 auxin-responsive promoter family protein [Bacteroidota bacterium]
MAILGSLIKGIIDISDKVIPESNPLEEQEEVLKSLLKKAKNTQFGSFYGFEAILESENPAKTFAEEVPFFDYNSLNEEWWSKLHDGESDVTWPGIPHYFALSSGTTGKSSKRIPVTDEMVDAI